MGYLMESSGIPKAKQVPPRLTPTNEHDKEVFVRLNAIKNNAKRFVDSGSNIYIASSNVGNGKTTWALKIMAHYFDEIWSGNGFRTRGLFVHVPTLLQKLKDFTNPLPESYKQALIEADLVIWDDIASTNLSPYDYGQLLIYIDNRVLNNKANIYTSNIVSEDELVKALGARLVSRVYTLSDKFEITGKDWRCMRLDSGSSFK